MNSVAAFSSLKDPIVEPVAMSFVHCTTSVLTLPLSSIFLRTSLILNGIVGDAVLKAFGRMIDLSEAIGADAKLTFHNTR